jgi:hypothetical protein
MSLALLLQKKIQPLAKKLLPRNDFGDRIYAQLYFLSRHGRLPGRAGWFNDELHKIKITECKDPLRVFVSDKDFMKLFVTARVGSQYTIPSIAVLNSKEEILGFDFPSRCVIKPTNSSGKIILRRMNEPIDREEISSWLRESHYDRSRESNYRYLKPKIIVEPFVFDRDDVPDYKIFCFNGGPRMIQVDIDRFSHHKRCLYDINWTLQPYTLGYPRADQGAARPGNLPEMLDLAARLSRGFGFVRIDFYSDGTQCAVGEITNCHGSGGERFAPPEGEAAASALIFGGGS